MKTITAYFLILLLAGIMPVFAQMEDPGQGTFNDPFVLNYLADSGALISVRVTGIERPADMEDRDAAPAGQEYAVVSVDVECAIPRSENCHIGSFDFTLSGDNGILYETAIESIDSGAAGMIEIELEPGDSASVSWPFLVSSDDTNLLLHYYNHLSMPFAFPQVFATEVKAETAEPIDVVLTVGIATRVGPSSDLSFAGIARRGETLPAHGRNADGSWLEITGIGWVPADFVDTDGDIMSLPIAR